MNKDFLPSNRTFSKRLVFACVALAWGALFYSIHEGQSSVAIAGFSFIATLGGAYMGVGHLDLRSLLKSLGNLSGTSMDTSEPEHMDMNNGS
jgi:hypothetical protein